MHTGYHHAPDTKGRTRPGPVRCLALAALLACLVCNSAQAGPKPSRPETAPPENARQEALQPDVPQPGGMQILFGAMARKLADTDMARTAEWQNWQRVINNKEASPPIEEIFAAMPGAYLAQWNAVCALYRKSPPLEQLRLVSGFFNSWAPKPDISLYGQEEYWASAEEFMQNTGGDCEDYAIVKYEALRLLGWDVNNLWLVLVDDNTRNANHAVLVARSADLTYVLDNLSAPRNLIMQEGKYTSLYTPIAAFSHNGMWLFDKEGKPTSTFEALSPQASPASP